MFPPHIKLFQKIKGGLELVSLRHFPHNFLSNLVPIASFRYKRKAKKLFWFFKIALGTRMFVKKNISLVIFINWPNFIVCFPLLCEIMGNICIAIVCKPGCDVMNFEVSLIFLIKPFFLHGQKSWQKLKYLENEKNF